MFSILPPLSILAPSSSPSPLTVTPQTVTSDVFATGTSVGWAHGNGILYSDMASEWADAVPSSASSSLPKTQQRTGHLLHHDATAERHPLPHRARAPAEPSRSFAASCPSSTRHNNNNNNNNRSRLTMPFHHHPTQRPLSQRRQLPPRQTDLLDRNQQRRGTLARAGPASRLERGSTPEATARTRHHGILYPSLRHRLKM
jgi:hypothetical protein